MKAETKSRCPAWICCVLCSAFCVSFLMACRSAKPPPTLPPTLEAADRATTQAQKFTRQQNWTLAARLWQEAANQYALLNDQPRLAIAWHNLAEANQNLDKLGEAEQFLQRAVEINQRLDRTNEWWRNQIALLQVEALAHKTNQLQARFERLTPNAPQQDPLIYGLFLNELALWQQKQGDLKLAEGTFGKAEQSFNSAKNPTGVATVLANQARLKEAQKQYPAALEIWGTALNRFEALSDPRGISDALAGLGRTHLALGKDLPKAEGYLRHAAANYQTLKLPQHRARTLEVLAQALSGQGKQSEAETVRRQAQALAK